MREYMRVVRELLAGNIVDYDFEGARRKIKFMHPVPGLVNLDDPIEWHVSAMGPRSRQLTAETGAGWINFMMGTEAAVADVEGVVQIILDHLGQGARLLEEGRLGQFPQHHLQPRLTLHPAVDPHGVVLDRRHHA